MVKVAKMVKILPKVKKVSGHVVTTAGPQCYMVRRLFSIFLGLFLPFLPFSCNKTFEQSSFISRKIPLKVERIQKEVAKGLFVFSVFANKYVYFFSAGMSESYYESGPQSISQIFISLCTGHDNASASY